MYIISVHKKQIMFLVSPIDMWLLLMCLLCLFEGEQEKEKDIEI